VVRLVEKHDGYMLVEKLGAAGAAATDLASEPEDG
jgi:hypothetical protein